MSRFDRARARNVRFDDDGGEADVVALEAGLIVGETGFRSWPAIDSCNGVRDVTGESFAMASLDSDMPEMPDMPKSGMERACLGLADGKGAEIKGDARRRESGSSTADSREPSDSWPEGRRMTGGFAIQGCAEGM